MVNALPVKHHHVRAVLVSLATPGNAVMLAFSPEIFPAWKQTTLSSSTSKQITLSPDARNTAWVSFDGRKRQEIQYGDWYVSLSPSAAVSFHGCLSQPLYDSFSSCVPPPPPPTVSRLLHLVTPCPPSVATTWCTTGSKAWPSVCTGTCARGKRDWPMYRTRQTLKTDSARHSITGVEGRF